MSDMNLQHFLFAKTPAGWHPYMLLMRLDRPTGTWLLLFPCWWGLVLAGRGIFNVDIVQVLLFALGALLMRSAGCIVNDLWDRELDAKVERTRNRPLASGAVTRRQAFSLLAVLLSLSFVILLTMGKLAVILGVASLLLVAAYPLMKRVTWWPQLFLGFTFNWGALLSWAAATGKIEIGALLVYIGGIFWTLAYDTVYAHQDIEDDMRAGIRSTARLFGERSKQYVKAFFASAIICFMVAKFMYTPTFLIALLLLPLIAHVVWQIKNWDMKSPQSSLRIFKSNTIFGWLVLLFFSL